MPIFNKGVNTLVEEIKLRADKADKFDLYEYMAPCTLDMICGEYDKKVELSFVLYKYLCT